MSSDERSSNRLSRTVSTVDSLPIAQNVLGGIGAFVGGLALFVMTITLTGNVTFDRPVRTLKELANIFYNAHNVPLLRHREIQIGDRNVVQESTINLLQTGDPSLPGFVYYLLPIVAIAIVGGLLARHYVDRSRLVETGGSVVAGVTLGYVLTAIVGAFLVGLRTGQERAFETLAPVKPLALAFGIAYPALVTAGAVGLVVAWQEWDRSPRPQES